LVGDGRNASRWRLVRDLYRHLDRPRIPPPSILAGRVAGSYAADVGSYHQFCPVAKAMELLDERWTMLVVRELVSGSEHFNELRRGVPRMSPSLLSKRLQELVRAGVVERHTDGHEVRYVLTAAGHELKSVVDALGVWGIRWMGELGDRDLDPKLLLWDMHRNLDRDTMPPERTVIRFRFPDAPPRTRDWWLVVTPDDADVCDADPGFDVAVTITAPLRRMVEVWRGDVTWSESVRSGALDVQGPEAVRRAVPRWLTLSSFAVVPRPA
jgi:DNA-binding HxlR family transcriptional regulator